MATATKGKQGKSENQKLKTYLVNETQRNKMPSPKLKPYLVLQILMRETDEDHVMSADKIAAELDDFGFNADRRSIYSDIEEINKACWALENGATIQEAEEALNDKETGEEEKLICYKALSRYERGFYVRQRRYDFQQIRLLAESVYTAKFLSEREADRLASVLCDFVSKHQAKTIKHDALLTDRVKTNNKNVLSNISTIDDAMALKIDGEPHTPEKISFKYLRHSIRNMQQVEARNGDRYVVSPYKLLINEGNYYLLTYSDTTGKAKTFRVDRMKDVRRTGEPRDGDEAFAQVNMKDYTRRTFSMFQGKTELVTIRFINRLLDTVVDRFGKDGVIYQKLDDDHFTVQVRVDISDQFFGWLLGFGRRAKLLEPPHVVEQYAALLDKVKEMY